MSFSAVVHGRVNHFFQFLSSELRAATNGEVMQLPCDPSDGAVASHSPVSSTDAIGAHSPPPHYILILACIAQMVSKVGVSQAVTVTIECLQAHDDAMSGGLGGDAGGLGVDGDDGGFGAMADLPDLIKAMSATADTLLCFYVKLKGEELSVRHTNFCNATALHRFPCVNFSFAHVRHLQTGAGVAIHARVELAADEGTSRSPGGDVRYREGAGCHA